jgi:hypothetical protein
MVPGSSATAATSTSPSKVSFTNNDRDVARKRVTERTERQTAGNTAKIVCVAASVCQIPSSRRRPPGRPSTSPVSLHSSRLENRTYLAEPTERRVIEKIDRRITIERRPSGRRCRLGTVAKLLAGFVPPMFQSKTTQTGLGYNKTDHGIKMATGS